MTVAKLSLEAKDVAIEFHDSCNCCCWSWKKTRSKTPLYVNSQGEVVKFDFQKAINEQEAIARSISNLKACLDESIEARKKDKVRIMQVLEEIEEIKNQKHLTKGVLEKIRDIIESWK